MAEPLPKRMLDSVASPAEIAQQSFDLERRGFDQRQVHAYLRAVADALRDAQQREADMRTRLGKAIQRAEAAEKAARTPPGNDPSELTRQIGEEVTAVLDAARAAGEQRIVAAEKSADRLLANAKAEANELRSAAETIMDERRALAEAAAKEIIAKGQAVAETLAAQARLDADATRAKAADRVMMVRDECDGLIREAEEARAQILEDMERRRRLARAQVERLRVGRDRLLRSYEIVRRTLEETTFELKTSLSEAKVRGDTAARLVAAEPLATREELEAEMAAAKIISSPRTPANPKGLTSPALPRRLDPPQVPNIDLRTESAPIPRKPQGSPPFDRWRSHRADGADTSSVPTRAEGSDAKQHGLAMPPRPPAVAPTLRVTSDRRDAPAAGLAGENGDDEVDVLAADDSGDAAMQSLAGSEISTTAIDDSEGIESDDHLGAAHGEVDSPLADNTAGTAGTAEDMADGFDGTDDLAANEPLDEELAQLEDRDLAIVLPPDDIEQVVALVVSSAAPDVDLDSAGVGQAPVVEEPAKDLVGHAKPPRHAPAHDLFATLRGQRETADSAADAAAALAAADALAAAEFAAVMVAQRDALIAESANQLERRLKRALADEQNDLLAGLRATTRNEAVNLTAFVGDLDSQLRRYVAAINDAAVLAYGAGAALVDATIRDGALPAGAVEELLVVDVIAPIRERLEAIAALEADSADLYVDPVRAFYRQRKVDHLSETATRLAQLLCTAGLCDALPPDTELQRFAQLSAALAFPDTAPR